MQLRLIFILFGLVLVTLVQGQTGSCVKDCVFSDECASEAGTTNCRCSYFHCNFIEDGQCGGGCVTDSQCSEWAGGTEDCVCGPLFECMRKSDKDKPGFIAFVRFMKSARGGEYQKKVDKMLRLAKSKERKSLE